LPLGHVFEGVDDAAVVNAGRLALGTALIVAGALPVAYV